ncbi:phage fiber-tail adaptor protein [Paraburkholderia dilworthii]|uniref:phage fiber-tail adaptor protein n=1 Tax=Paraburkholderia dilworthii TaxID=948106 RepID=UPI000483CB6F|nr:hypothetical protein [Paraburkholderia dilworthii]
MASASVAVLTKDPNAVLDFGLDLSPVATQLASPWLAPGEQVVELTVTADSGLTVNSSSIAMNASGVTGALLIAWLAGGVAGTTYNVRFQFTTNSTPSRTDCRSLQIQCATR